MAIGGFFPRLEYVFMDAVMSGHMLHFYLPACSWHPNMKFRAIKWKVEIKQFKVPVGISI